MVSTYVTWGEARVKLTWKQDYLGPRELMTSAHGFCFWNGKLLIVDLNHRGWDFPGGHIEPNETPEEAFKREAMEEGYVEGDCSFLGCVEVSHHENPNWRKDSPYPLVGYQAFYRMDIKQLHNFDAEYESSKREFIEPYEIENYKNWDTIYQALLEYAMKKEAV
ncbi:NUDIX hydrolase [Ornithinibacillus xuwenensis]|uniref:NUDIX domain-containing protein n=1 Tax=Ornithinibacillus xuwenensis TaxID=3144668 RepID=A0ABU9XHT4_9BACI